MKRLIPILLLIGFMATVMKPVGPYAEYLLNIEFIANNYCVNQDRPELKCKGKCYLMKQIKEQAESSSDQDVLQIVVAPEFPVLPVSSYSLIATQDLEINWPVLCQDWRVEWLPEPASPPPRYIHA